MLYLKFIRHILILAVLVALPARLSAAPPVHKLGGAFALTGNAAPFGTQELRGAELAIAEVNSRGKIRLEMKVEDTASSGVGTVTAVQKLLEVDGLRLIIGPTWLDSFQGALALAERRRALLFTPSAGISNIKRVESDYPLVFSSYFNFEKEIVFLVEHAASTGARRLAILFDQDPYFQAMRRFALGAARRRGLEVAIDQDFAQGDKDFRSLLVRMKSQTPDSVIFGSVDESSVLSFFRQRAELSPNLRVLGTHDLDGYAGNDDFKRVLAGVEYVVPGDASAAFKQAYRSRFQTDPMMSASNAYDAVMMIASGLERGRSEPADLAAFLRTSEFLTATFGPTRFSSLGGVEAGTFIIKKW